MLREDVLVPQYNTGALGYTQPLEEVEETPVWMDEVQEFLLVMRDNAPLCES